jgi:hypothetical protein
MELEGKIIQINPLQSGESKNGTWKKQEFIVETKSQYPKKVCISVWGDKIDQFGLKQNEVVTLSIELESREFNGRWYTDVKAWKVDRAGAAHYDVPEPEILPPSNEPPMEEAPPF